VSKAQRQLAKAVNFDLLYGMRARGFQVYARSNYGVTLSPEELRTDPVAVVDQGERR
jgi:DNA polymerase-1